MFTLFWEYLAGSIVVQAVLEEIGADYRLQYVDMSTGEHQRQEFLNINPAGRIPALSYSDGKTIGETAAIVTLLGEMFPESKVTPNPADEDRGEFLFWINVMTTAGYMTSGRVGHPERYARTSEAIEQVGEKALADYDAFFDIADGAIAGKPWFLERGPTALDYYLTMLTEWHADKPALFAARPSLAALCNEVAARPSYRAAMRTHALPAT